MHAKVHLQVFVRLPLNFRSRSVLITTRLYSNHFGNEQPNNRSNRFTFCLGTGLFKRQKMHRRWCKRDDGRQAAKYIQDTNKHGLAFEPLAFDNE